MQQVEKKGFSGLQVVGIMVAVTLVTVLLTLFAARAWLFPKPFTPVVLSSIEEQQLEKKLERFEMLSDRSTASKPSSLSQGQKMKSGPAPSPGVPVQPGELTSSGNLKPEAYSEKGASREIKLSEREMNSLVAKNTDLARKVAIDLADDLISLKILLPVDPDFPMLGGKTLRVRAGAELAYRYSRPIVKLRGVSIMGVPVPNAWLGGLKNIDLVSEFGTDTGFWKTFADGVESMSVREGELYIKLKE
jgi:hypothetical protein